MSHRLLVVAGGLAAMLWTRGTLMPDVAASRHSSEVIPAWHAVARAAPATPVQLSRVLAMVHAAMHDAVNGADPRYETYASDLTDPRADPETAAAAAAHRVLSSLFPTLQGSWDAALAESVSGIHGRARSLGLKLGAAVGDLVLDTRAGDGWNGVDTAIHEAGTDGNPGTSEDPVWQPLRTTPGHPDHRRPTA